MPQYQVGSTSLFGHPSRDAFMADVAEAQNIRDRATARAFKWLRLPVMTGIPASSAVSIGGGPPLVGPESGYAWSLRRIVIDGMTTGNTPDEINMYRNATTGPPLWQFNGNNFAYTFSKLEMVLQGGDTLMFASVGSFAATGQIRVSGELVEVPAEMLWKLV